MGVPVDGQVVQAKTGKDKASVALLEIYDLVKKLYTLAVENNNLIKSQPASKPAGGTVTYEGMINYIAQRPMWKLTDKQIYYMVERGDDIRYIQAVSGYKMEDIKKKYEQHKKNNVYRW